MDVNSSAGAEKLLTLTGLDNILPDKCQTAVTHEVINT